MKKYILVFCALVFTSHQSNSIQNYPEIAINTQAKVIVEEDKHKSRCVFIPIMVYLNDRLVCGTFIPWHTIGNADDGSKINNDYDTYKKRCTYRCNQRRASGNKTFRQALAEVVAKKAME